MKQGGKGRADGVSLSWMYWMATLPSMEPTANPSAEGKQLTVRVWYFRGDSISYWKGKRIEGKGRWRGGGEGGRGREGERHLERNGWVIEVVDLEFPVRSADHEDGELCIHGIASLRQIHTQGCLALSQIPVLRRKKEREGERLSFKPEE